MIDRADFTTRQQRPAPRDMAPERRLRSVPGRQNAYIDYPLIFIVVVLVAFGLLMLYSTSAYEAALQFNGDSAYYFRHQLMATLLGFAVMILTALIPYRFWKNLAVPAYIGSVIAVLLVLTPLGIERNGARRWLRIGGTSVQPAELAKLGIIIFLAALICRLGANVKERRGKALMLLTPLPLSGLLYLVTDNLSSAVIVFGIAVIMLFVATPDYRGFLLTGAALSGVAALALYLFTHVAWFAEKGFRIKRILIWLNPEAYADGKGFQTLQALYAIGSGGVLGKGLGQSMQKLGFVPEAQNDMIFSIICEELGLFGAFMVILMFVVLLWRMMVIANNAPDLFGSMLVVGVMGHILIQVILNIAVVTNTLPNTGITLPFISYGGTSILFLMAEIGLTLSVAKGIRT